MISIHALCEEGDKASGVVPEKLRLISIHALCEEGDVVYCYEVERRLYFYPRPLRGGRLGHQCHGLPRVRISIHALCEEGDKGYSPPAAMRKISIHALCEEGDSFFFA